MSDIFSTVTVLNYKDPIKYFFLFQNGIAWWYWVNKTPSFKQIRPQRELKLLKLPCFQAAFMFVQLFILRKDINITIMQGLLHFF